jgi:hypothetical protein
MDVLYQHGARYIVRMSGVEVMHNEELFVSFFFVFVFLLLGTWR